MPGQLPLVIAHRGASRFAHENTMEAFRPAFEKFHADMIEFDVRLSKDGVPVILHDATLDRTTGGKGYVSKYSAKGLKAFHIPTLEEVFSALPGKSFAVEIKENSAELTRVVMDLVKKFSAEGRVIVGSKHHRVSETMRREFPKTRRFLSQSDVALIAADFKLGKKSGAEDPYAVASMPVERFGFRLDRPEFIDYLHQRKISVFYWTINEASVMKVLSARGADGLITDNPALLNQVLGRCETDPKGA